MALTQGGRGLQGGSSLARLLAEERGVRNRSAPPELTKQQILAWADEHHERTEQWPNQNAGSIPGTIGENWTGINWALREGARGFPGGSSLAQLLADERGLRNRATLPELTKEQILAWADAHHERTGQWPRPDSGPIVDAPGETWQKITGALRKGQRGLTKVSSLAQLLLEERGVRHHLALSKLTEEQILIWAKAHKEFTGDWPKQQSGPIVNAPGETWLGVNAALSSGNRGLPGGSSIPKLLAQRCGVRHYGELPRLTLAQIVEWAERHKERTGDWPKSQSGPILDAPGETWSGVNQAIIKGHRGFSGGSSLARLLEEYRQ
jgi:hypothetical protein